MLGRVVADAVAAGYEDHAGRADAGHHLGVVTSARRHPLDGVAEVGRRSGHRVNYPGVELHRLEAGQGPLSDLDALAGR